VVNLERYRPVIDDFEDFHAANHTPEAVTLRVRTGLRSMDAVRASLESQGFELAAIPGLPDYLKVVDGPHSVAQTLDHWLGHLHIQQAVMALPSLALAPRPGERVLDLCAAPGGKTSHLAELMEDRGCLVAVDPKEKRLRGLMSNLFRLGLSNVVVIASDGRELPDGALFDRVLVDAPCSAEGNYRRHQGRLPTRDARFVRYVTELQTALLNRAIDLTRPGGRIVYSTCTFAPEENEGVVSRVLDRVRLVEGGDLPHAPGLTSWKGESFPDEMVRARRYYPQHLDSGGAFVAVLKKVESAGDRKPATDGWSPIPVPFPGEDPDTAHERVETARKDLLDRYGFDGQVLEDLGWLVRGENIWVQTAGEWPVDGWKEGGWRVVSTGLRAFRADSRGRETPSNQFLGRFAHHLGPQRRRVLDDDELRTLLAGDPVEDETLPAGPIALIYHDWVIGRGMVGHGGLRHQIPSTQARRLGALLGIDQTQPEDG
jgi:NOL1/NOP2/sun family putative RNA methylase